MTLAKTDLDDRRALRALARARSRCGTLFDVIRAEHDLTVAEVLRVTGETALLDDQP